MDRDDATPACERFPGVQGGAALGEPAHRPGTRAHALPKDGSLFEVGLWSQPLTPSAEPLTAALHAPARSASAAPGRARVPRAREPDRPFRGRPVGTTALRGAARDLAWDATLRRAAGRHWRPPQPLFPQDLRCQERRPPRGRLLVLVVDLSGSMGTALMALARHAATALLAHAHVHRDRLALLGFRAERAEILVPTTNRAEALRRPLGQLATGGTTPLCAGLALAERLLGQEERRHARGATDAALVLVSDGRGNVGEGLGRPAVSREIATAAHRLAHRPHLRRLLVDTTEGGKPDEAARVLADQLEAHRLALAALEAAGVDPLPLITGWLESG